MSYKSIIVNLAIDAPPAPVVRVGIELAERFGAHLIGLAAADVPPLVATDEGMVYEGEVMQIQRTEVEKQLAEVREAFETMVPASISSEWRQAVCSPTNFLSISARAADLIVTEAGGGENVFRDVDIGSLALGAGRPVLVTASNHRPLKTALVAWKDTREARRAVADAMPFLIEARDVVIASVDRGNPTSRDNVADLELFLSRHGVKARSEVLNAWRAEPAELLLQLGQEIAADLIVLGGYGHSRVLEMTFGGVTRSMLRSGSLHRFISH